MKPLVLNLKPVRMLFNFSFTKFKTSSSDRLFVLNSRNYHHVRTISFEI